MKSAALISSMGYKVQWITPLGLLVVQPYQRKKIIKVHTYVCIQWQWQFCLILIGK